MEYEIEEEGELLDESNNPSLDHSARPVIGAAWGKPQQPDPRKLQKAERIPEESDAA
jgi:hypothetical protein